MGITFFFLPFLRQSNQYKYTYHWLPHALQGRNAEEMREKKRVSIFGRKVFYSFPSIYVTILSIINMFSSETPVISALSPPPSPH